VDGRILKFLRVGKVPVKGTEFSCHEEAFLEAEISPVITNRNAIYILIGLPITCYMLSKGRYILPNKVLLST